MSPALWALRSDTKPRRARTTAHPTAGRSIRGSLWPLLLFHQRILIVSPFTQSTRIYAATFEALVASVRGRLRAEISRVVDRRTWFRDYKLECRWILDLFPINLAYEIRRRDTSAARWAIADIMDLGSGPFRHVALSDQSTREVVWRMIEFFRLIGFGACSKSRVARFKTKWMSD